MVTRGCFILLALACVSVLAVPLHAQTSIEVGPLVGYYRPVGHFRPPSSFTLGSLPYTPSDMRGTAWGANARLWLGHRFGVEASGMIASSRVGFSPIDYFYSRQARVFAVAVEVLYNFSPAGAKYRAWLGAGPGLVRHFGDAYAPVGSFVDVAGVVGAGGSIRLLPHLAAVGRVGMALYNYDIPMSDFEPTGTGELQSGFQEDLLFRFGVDWTWR